MYGNWLKTTLLMAAIMALFGAVGMVLGGKTGMLVALGFGALTNFWAYWFSDKMVLAMYHAQEVDETTSPYLYGIVRELARRAGLPMPKVYIIHEAQPNAFATGRDPEHAAVAATTGIIELLNERELRGVLAHELAHIKHRDILISTMTATVAGAISMLANFGMLFGGRDEEGRPVNPVLAILVMILAPIAAVIIQLAISRTREFGATRAERDLRRPGGAGFGPGQDRSVRPADSHANGRGTPGDGADDDHEPALGRLAARALLDAPAHRRAHRPAAGDGGADASPLGAIGWCPRQQQRLPLHF